MKQIRICFISRQAYPYLSKKDFNSAGGAELQDFLLAREFKKRGYKIHFIVGDYGQDDHENIGGFDVHKSFSFYEKGILGKISGLIKFWILLSKIDADVYYRMTPHTILGIVGFFCKLKKKIFIFSAGSDINFEVSSFVNKSSLFKLSYKYALKNADIVISQNIYQKESAYKNFGANSTIINSIVEVPKEISIKRNIPNIIFVGTLISHKQPEIFIELAKIIKEANFYIIGPCKDKEYYEILQNLSVGIKNLKFCGFIQHDKMRDIYKKDIILVNTSKYEGFPNTFLEAWAYGNPVVSLNADPDEVICKYKLGFHSRNFDKMVEDLNILIKNKKLRMELGYKGRKYVEENHSSENIIDEFENLILNKYLNLKL